MWKSWVVVYHTKIVCYKLITIFHLVKVWSTLVITWSTQVNVRLTYKSTSGQTPVNVNQYWPRWNELLYTKLVCYMNTEVVTIIFKKCKPIGNFAPQIVKNKNVDIFLFPQTYFTMYHPYKTDLQFFLKNFLPSHLAENIYFLLCEISKNFNTKKK